MLRGHIFDQNVKFIAEHLIFFHNALVLRGRNFHNDIGVGKVRKQVFIGLHLVIYGVIRCANCQRQGGPLPAKQKMDGLVIAE